MPLTPASGDTGYWAHLVSLCAMNLLSDSLYKGINIHKYFIKVDMNVDIFFLQEEFYGREIILADRDMVETNSGNFFFYLDLYKKWL